MRFMVLLVVAGCGGMPAMPGWMPANPMDPFAAPESGPPGAPGSVPGAPASQAPAPAQKAPGLGNPLDLLAKAKDDPMGALAGVAGDGPATCCVNQQFFECPNGAAAVKCLGKPFDLGPCTVKCSGDGAVECLADCVARFGPKPEDCARTPARDGECPPPK